MLGLFRKKAPKINKPLIRNVFIDINSLLDILGAKLDFKPKLINVGDKPNDGKGELLTDALIKILYNLQQIYIHHID